MQSIDKHYKCKSIEKATMDLLTALSYAKPTSHISNAKKNCYEILRLSQLTAREIVKYDIQQY